DTGSNSEWQAFLSGLGVEVSKPEAVPTVEAEPTPPPVGAPSAGHTASFAKPVNGAPAASVPTAPPAPTPSARKPAILVVDDAGRLQRRPPQAVHADRVARGRPEGPGRYGRRAVGLDDFPRENRVARRPPPTRSDVGAAPVEVEAAHSVDPRPPDLD